VAVEVGSSLPDMKLTVVTNGETEERSSIDLLGKGKVVLFGVPGAFTPTCSDYHLPGFVLRSEELKAKGVGLIACLSVNDSFVMSAWAKAQNVEDHVVLIADGNGDFTKSLGLEMDASPFGMGLRSKRFAMVIEDGKVTHLAVEPGGGLDVSSAEAILQVL
jgi:peroxiredoxin